MARIRKWQETLMVACAALFFSVTRAWPLATGNAPHSGHPAYSRLVTGMSGKTAFGIEIGAGRPYLRFFRASLAPVAMPLAAGAYVAMAGAEGAPATSAAPAAASSCNTCNKSTATCCSHADGDKCCNPDCTRSCTEITCTGLETLTHHCITCFHGTCTCHP